MRVPRWLAAPGPLSLALTALAWLALSAWARPLMLPDEGRYVGVAWEMMRSGRWLVPTLDGLPYFHKPPLFYWITATAMTAFGTGEWAARAAPLLGAWLGAMAMFLFLRRWAGEASARLALVVLLAQPLYYLGGQFANLDMLVAGCISATVLLLAHAALQFERGAPWRSALGGAYALAALGMLAKGLIGVVLPALVIVAWLAAGRRWRTLVRLAWLPGAGVFLALAGPWFVAMQARFPAFLDYFFVVQHFKRYADAGFNNAQPFWFYPVVLAVLTLPWLPWLAPLIERARPVRPAQGDLRRLMLWWTVVVVGFFSLPASKLVGYVLPAVVPLAVLIADGIQTLRERNVRAVRWWKLSAALTVTLSLAAVVVLVQRTPHSSKALGQTLGALRTAHEPVYMVGHYYFDLPLYARLASPAGVVLDWSDPQVTGHDAWPKELADAGAFARERSAEVLLNPAQFSALGCARQVSWVIGPPQAGASYPFLAAAQVSARSGEAVLWRVDGERARLTGALHCPGTPTAG